MKPSILFLIILLPVIAFGQDQPIRIGIIEFFGYAGIDLDKVREALPFREGEELNIEKVAEKKRQSSSQIAALVHASRDSNSGVRNNATRALLVLAESNPKRAKEIPADKFIELLLSGTWTDLNKASGLLCEGRSDTSPQV
jgi:hypothetical protein